MRANHLPFTVRLVVRGARGVLSLLRLIAPGSIRERWTEEWRAEIEHAAECVAGRKRAALHLVGFFAGVVPDVVRLRRLPRSSGMPARRGAAFHGIGQDFRYAARNLRTAPTFTVTVIASLSIGIAALSGAFAFINAALFPTLPGVADHHRLVEIALERSSFDDMRVLREAVPAFRDVTGTTRMRFAVGARGHALSVNGAIVSANYFEVLGVRMSAGRSFTAGEDRPVEAPVAVIGFALARRLFGREASALDEFINVGGHPTQIVGVAAEDFGGTSAPGRDVIELWLPAGAIDRIAPPQGQAGLRQYEPEMTYIGRVSANASIRQALSQAEFAAAQVSAARAPGRRRMFSRVRQVGVKGTSGLAVEIAAVMLVPAAVLLIGCINAANLLLVRGLQRARDTGVRLALGASRWRVVRQWLAECVLLALLSAAAAVPLLAWALGVLETVVPFTIRLDLQVVAFAIAIALASVAAFGLAPALRLSGAGSAAALRSWRDASTVRRSRVRQVLVVAQVALSLGLLATGGQLVTAVAHLAGVTGVQDPSKLLMVSYDLTQLKVAPAAAEDFYDRLLERVQRMPGVERAGLARGTALWTWGWTSGGNYPLAVWLPGAAPRDSRLMLGGYVGGDLFQAAGLRLLRGRAFRPEDRIGRPRVAVVNRTAADRYFNGVAIGQMIRVAARGQGYETSHEVQIVGVIEAALEPDYSRTPDASVPGLYLPARLEHEPALTLYIRARDTVAGLPAAIREATDQIDPRVPFDAITTLQERRYVRQTEERLAAQGLTIVGVVALALACGGLYGMVSFLVSTRRREIGVRMALGAHPRGILRLVLKQGMSTAVVGALVGGATATALSIVLRANMYGVPALDVRALVLTMALLAAAVLLASFVPARRAARIDPLIVLREE